MLSQNLPHKKNFKGMKRLLIFPFGRKLAGRMNIPIKHSNCSDPNAEETISIIKALKQSVIIYSGPAGAILKETVLNLGKKFLHVHPGIVPKFRGSTTIYYSLLKEGTVGASAFFMDRKIDQGPIIRQDTFPNFEKNDEVEILLFEDSHASPTSR